MVTPESLATTPSMPVPTKGAWLISSGTAWRCMLDPIKARLASSFSRNGIREAETLTSWLGEMSISSISSRSTIMNSPSTREVTSGLTYSPLLVDRRIGLGDGVVLLLEGAQETGHRC